MPDRIFLSAPDVRDLERQYVMDAIDSNWIAPAGPALDRFESELAAATGRRRAVGLASGTAALHLALLEAGVARGDRVVCSSLTFIGSAAPIVHCGAQPVFVDAEPVTWNIDADLLDHALTTEIAAGHRPAAVVSVDLYGICADYTRIVEICQRHDIPLIEDAAEAVGATCGTSPSGSFGVSAILSFNGNKLITTSGGGALVTDDDDLADRVRFLSTQAREPAVHYEHREIGYNYRLSNLLAALGSAQLARLDDRIARRHQIFERYRDALSSTPGTSLLEPPSGSRSNHWLTCVRFGADSPTTPQRLIDALDRENIESRPVWKPMHLQPVFADAPTYLNGTSDALFAEGVCLPSGSGMSDGELQRVLDVIETVLS